MNILNLLGSDLKEKLQSEGLEKFLDFLGDERLEKKKRADEKSSIDVRTIG